MSMQQGMESESVMESEGVPVQARESAPPAELPPAPPAAAAAGPQAPSAQAASEWACAVCTFVNSSSGGSGNTCAMCGAARPVHAAATPEVPQPAETAAAE